MPFLDNIPQSTNLISNSQSQILANFAFLGDIAGSTQPGFYKLPNGLIIQWALNTGNWLADPSTGPNPGENNVTFVGATTGPFPIAWGLGMQAFPNNCFFVIPIYNSVNNLTKAAISVFSLTKNGFIMTSSGSSNGFWFLAIGN